MPPFQQKVLKPPILAGWCQQYPSPLVQCQVHWLLTIAHPLLGPARFEAKKMKHNITYIRMSRIVPVLLRHMHEKCAIHYVQRSSNKFALRRSKKPHKNMSRFLLFAGGNLLLHIKPAVGTQKWHAEQIQRHTHNIVRFAHETTSKKIVVH